MRSLWIKIHLYVAAFFLPMLLAMAVSGGLYLLGVKGSVDSTPVSLSATKALFADSRTLDRDVRELLNANGIAHDFEYIKVSGNKVITRPTSTNYYEFIIHEDEAQATLNRPDLIKSLVELHKGHGPLFFKDLQKLMALGLLIVLLSGFWLGASSAGLRVPTLLTTIAGLSLFLGLGFSF
ncbi:hypothetical protein OAL10_05960 [Gammaproteobacteria bacterium]|nr:hypothetical protein [Gammaproteobacteria bacterium]